MRSPSAYRFGPFEADLRHAQLRKYGVRVRLERKPWILLLALLERPGQIIAREELERRLWGEEVFVDFEHGINVAVKKVRAALCDSVEGKRYIETIPGEGYRFIAEVEVVSAESPVVPSHAPDDVAVTAPKSEGYVPAIAIPRRAGHRHLAAAMAFGAVLALLAVVLIGARFGSRPSLSNPTAERATGNAEEQGISTAAISPDGRYLAFVVGQRIWLKQLATGDVHPIQVQPELVPFGLDWYADSASLLATDKQGVWRVSILGGGAEKIFGPALFASASPDGKQLAVTSKDRRHIIVTDSGGEHAHQVAALPDGIPGYFSRPAWSPTGKRVAYLKHWADAQGKDAADIETVRTDGTNASVALTRFPIAQLLWLNDGRMVYNVQKPPRGMTNLWTVPVDENTGRAASLGEPITDRPDFNFRTPSATTDGHVIAFVRQLARIDVYTTELSPEADKLGQLERASFGTSYSYTYPGSWDSDNSLLVSASGDWNSVILRQPLSGAPASPLVPISDGHQSGPQLSPNGRWLLWVRESNEGHSAEVLRMPRTGGPVESLYDATGVAFGLRCPLRSGDCVFLAQGPQTTFHAIDPDTGTSRELFHWKDLGTAVDFDVAPQGDKLLVCEPVEGGKVFVVDLPTGGNRRELGSGESGTWRWLPDDKGWLVSHITLPDAGSEVFRVDESGKRTVLWKSTSERYGLPQISADGRHVAFARFSTESNVWLLHF